MMGKRTEVGKEEYPWTCASLLITKWAIINMNCSFAFEHPNTQSHDTNILKDTCLCHPFSETIWISFEIKYWEECPMACLQEPVRCEILRNSPSVVCWLNGHYSFSRKEQKTQT